MMATETTNWLTFELANASDADWVKQEVQQAFEISDDDVQLESTTLSLRVAEELGPARSR